MTERVYVDRDGKAGNIQFPRTLAGAYVTIDDPTDPAPAAPNKSATKAEWVAYAVSVGADADEAEAATRDDLIETYGGD
jgi:hypothetical protein